MNIDYIPNNALIACSRLVDFAGAEISAIEIAMALHDLGVEVELAAFEFSSPIVEVIQSHSLKFTNLSKSKISNKYFDLVWISHYPMAYHLFINEGVIALNAIYSSLSHFEPLETPPISGIFFSKYLVNSQENFEIFSERYPHFSERTEVFHNSVPKNFFLSIDKLIEPEIKSIAIVSNHPPFEFEELKLILAENNITVDTIGVHGTKVQVTPELLNKYSAIITIGKTVQYCLAAGIPVYCYDHFGGPGWITKDILDSALSKNFSGRCSPRKNTGREIFNNLIYGYADALNNISSLNKIAQLKFNLSTNIRKILNSIKDFNSNFPISKTDKEILSEESKLFINLRGVIENYDYGSKILEKKIRVLLNDIDLLKQSIKEYKKVTSNNRIINYRNLHNIEALKIAKYFDEKEILHLKYKLLNFNKISIKQFLTSDSAFKNLSEENNFLEKINQKLYYLNNEIKIRDKKNFEQAEIIKKNEEEILFFNLSICRLNEKIAAIYRSTSWRATSIPRVISEYKNIIWDKIFIKVAWGKFLIKKSYSVLLHQGFIHVIKKIIFYIKGAGRRKYTHFRNKKYILHQRDTVSNHNDYPLFSFVIPIYDRTETLRIAIFSALNQTYKNIEVILVTDGSPPDTLSVVNEFINDKRVKIFNYPTSSGNAVRGRNKGILESSGSYIAFLDSDDIAEPNRIQLSLNLLKSGTADVVYGAWRVLLDGTREIAGLADGQIVFSPDCDLKMLTEICVPCQSTVIVRKSFFYRAGFLKLKMEYREDHELWTRLSFFDAKFKSISQPLASLRLHSGNNELKFKENDEYWSDLLKNEYKIKALIPKKIVFIVAGLGISGGLIVILKHASHLMSIGHDVFIINTGEDGKIDWSGQISVPVVKIDDSRKYLFEKIEILFSTFWMTCEWLNRLEAIRKIYFIQSDERLFYEEPEIKNLVENTYKSQYEFVTIARWIGEMLIRDFHKSSYLIPNGISLEHFRPDAQFFENRSKRIRVLIEGPLTIPFKGVADAYAAVKNLDCDIWLVSSSGKPDSSWNIDRFFENLPFNQMPHIYASCDILIKMSRIESFSYPPLEAMACGCAVVVGKVMGSMEYIVDTINALVVESGDIKGATSAVRYLIENPEIRSKLVEEGIKTSKNWSWDNSFKAMTYLVDM